ncbi:alpha/beta fold hydrolase [Terricaulis sp.]|uniref:alpha/beta fold hydrolase n=1 Tax=Terricaulis sp. TaxID=2768686 RepID=UPI0037847337
MRTHFVILCAAFAVWAVQAGASACDGPRCVSGQSAAVQERVAVQGAELFLSLHGPSCDAPILLWLHGGPGGAERPLFRHFNGDLEERYNVAYLDQRGAGLSFDPQADPSELTIARHVLDLDQIIDRLHARFPDQPIVLVGHSWGAALGLIYAHGHPGKVAAVVAVAPLVASLDQQSAELAFVAEQARRRGDARVLDDIDRMRPPLDVRQILRLQQADDRYGGVFHRRPSFTAVTLSGLAQGLIAPWDIGRFIRANNVSLRAMHGELGDLDLRVSVRAVATPVVFMLGRYDHHLDSSISAAYFQALDAPRKELIWFAESAHNIPFEQPDLFNDELTAVLTRMGAPPCR